VLQFGGAMVVEMSSVLTLRIIGDKMEAWYAKRVLKAVTAETLQVGMWVTPLWFYWKNGFKTRRRGICNTQKRCKEVFGYVARTSPHRRSALVRWIVPDVRSPSRQTSMTHSVGGERKSWKDYREVFHLAFFTEEGLPQRLHERNVFGLLAPSIMDDIGTQKKEAVTRADALKAHMQAELDILCRVHMSPKGVSVADFLQRLAETVEERHNEMQGQSDELLGICDAHEPQQEAYIPRTALLRFQESFANMGVHEMVMEVQQLATSEHGCSEEDVASQEVSKDDLARLSRLVQVQARAEDLEQETDALEVALDEQERERCDVQLSLARAQEELEENQRSGRFSLSWLKSVTQVKKLKRAASRHDRKMLKASCGRSKMVEGSMHARAKIGRLKDGSATPRTFKLKRMLEAELQSQRGRLLMDLQTSLLDYCDLQDLFVKTTRGEMQEALTLTEIVSSVDATGVIELQHVGRH